MTSATDELRRMLDERGVEWDADDEIMDDGSTSQVTYWHSNDIEWSADGRDEYLAFDAVQLITPEQAIAATLGAGTCKRVFYEPTGVYVCSECGRGLSKKLDKYCYLHYCPNCGRRVEVSDG